MFLITSEVASIGCRLPWYVTISLATNCEPPSAGCRSPSIKLPAGINISPLRLVTLAATLRVKGIVSLGLTTIFFASLYWTGIEAPVRIVV